MLMLMTKKHILCDVWRRVSRVSSRSDSWPTGRGQSWPAGGPAHNTRAGCGAHGLLAAIVGVVRLGEERRMQGSGLAPLNWRQ